MYSRYFCIEKSWIFWRCVCHRMQNVDYMWLESAELRYGETQNQTSELHSKKKSGYAILNLIHFNGLHTLVIKVDNIVPSYQIFFLRKGRHRVSSVCPSVRQLSWIKLKCIALKEFWHEMFIFWEDFHCMFISYHFIM